MSENDCSFTRKKTGNVKALSSLWHEHLQCCLPSLEQKPSWGTGWAWSGTPSGAARWPAATLWTCCGVWGQLRCQLCGLSFCGCQQPASTNTLIWQSSIKRIHEDEVQCGSSRFNTHVEQSSEKGVQCNHQESTEIPEICHPLTAKHVSISSLILTMKQQAHSLFIVLTFLRCLTLEIKNLNYDRLQVECFLEEI